MQRAAPPPQRARVEVVHADAGAVARVPLEFDLPATVADALALAAARQPFSGLDLEAAAVGIFGRLVGRDRMLQDGDRVEIHTRRALDPMQARRARARGARAPRRPQ